MVLAKASHSLSAPEATAAGVIILRPGDARFFIVVFPPAIRAGEAFPGDGTAEPIAGHLVPVTDSSPDTRQNPPKLGIAVQHSARVWNSRTRYLRRPIYAPGRVGARNHSRSE